MKFKSHLYFEEKDRFKENLEKLKTLPGSKITFFKNGQNLGTAFEDIYGVSLHCFKGNRLFVHLKNTYVCMYLQGDYFPLEMLILNLPRFNPADLSSLITVF